MACRRSRSGSRGICCASAATTRRGGWSRARAILFTVLTVSLEIRHYMNGGDIYRHTGSLGELALQICAGLAMTIGFEHLRHRTGSVVHDVGALVIAALMFAGIVFGLWMVRNPLFTGEPVGGAFLNLILLGYGIPAVLAIVLAMRTRDVRPHAYRICAAAIAVLLMLSYLSLEVRTLYHGPVLSAARLGCGAVHLFGGLARLRGGVAAIRHRVPLAAGTARFGGVTLLTVAKVFLVDMAGLTGVFRALSFIGLGLVLVGIGWLYQRLLFPPGAKTRRRRIAGAAD